MRRKAFTLASALSLMVCIATAVLWVRSYFIADLLLRSSFEDEGGWTYWKQQGLLIGRGGSDTTPSFRRGRIRV